jgi:hypothetical protein
MKIETLDIGIVSSEDNRKWDNVGPYNPNQKCQCCGGNLEPVKQTCGISYYFLVNDRAISPKCLGDWLGKIGKHIADDPHPYWLHAAINTPSAMGRKGGSVKSDKKSASSRENGKLGGRPGMYDIEIVTMSGEDYPEAGLNKSAAIASAKKYAEQYPKKQVFISWFRKSDGQRGYLNPDGNHDITGKAW